MFGQETQGLHRDLEEKLRMQAGRVVDGVGRIHLVSLVTFELVLASWVIGRGRASRSAHACLRVYSFLCVIIRGESKCGKKTGTTRQFVYRTRGEGICCCNGGSRRDAGPYLV